MTQPGEREDCINWLNSFSSDDGPTPTRARDLLEADGVELEALRSDYAEVCANAYALLQELQELRGIPLAAPAGGSTCPDATTLATDQDGNSIGPFLIKLGGTNG